MKLDELEIGDAGAGAIRQRDAVAGCHARIGRLAKDLTRAARREQRGAGAHRVPGAAPIVERGADRGAALDQQLGDERVVDRLDRRTTGDAHAADLAAGASPACRPTDAVCAASRRRRTAVGLAMNRVPLDQLADVVRPADEHPHRRLVAQAKSPTNIVSRACSSEHRRLKGRGDAAARNGVISWDRLCDTRTCSAGAMAARSLIRR